MHKTFTPPPQGEPSTFSIRQAHQEDVAEIASSLRTSDVDALSLLGVQDIFTHIQEAYKRSQERLTIEMSGVVAALGGVHIVTPPGYTVAVGLLWIVGTDSLTHWFETILRALFERLSPLCDVLTVCCCEQDAQAREALEREGFSRISKPHVLGASFLQFTKEC